MLRLHPDQFDVSVQDAARLIRAQFPDLAPLEITPVPSSGTMNAIFRIGDRYTARLPFVPWGADAIRNEAALLPRLAGALPVRVPTVVGVGAPDERYPCPWLVLEWLPGTTPQPGSGSPLLADDIAEVLLALRAMDAAGAMASPRGRSLLERDVGVRDALGQITDLVDVPRLLRLWEVALAAVPWSDAPVWLHGDLLPANLLLRGGRLVGVLDVSAAGVGDPAGDLLVAWNLFDAGGRRRLRDAIGVDDATWLRGQGAALAQAAIALPYYRASNEGMTGSALRALSELAATSA